MATVIVGAGIIGTSTAYYLSQSPYSTPPSSIHLIDSSPELFASASGYAAGFIARNWFSPPLASLGALSFDLHKLLAEENNGPEKWGYSKSTSTSFEETIGKRGEDWLAEGASRSQAANSSGGVITAENDRPVWLRGRGNLDVISRGDTTAQIDPLRLCRHLLETIVERGVNVHHPAHVISVTRSSLGELQAIRIKDTQEEHELPCRRLVIAAGAWTPKVFRSLFPSSKINIPITSLAGHSLLLRSPHWPSKESHFKSATAALPGIAESPSCHAIFTTDPSGYSPELFSRSPGHIYVAGLNSSTYPLPDVATERLVSSDSIVTLQRTAERLLGEGLIVEREGVCWRPVTRRGVPIVAELSTSGEDGVIIAAGHGAWGISLSLGTGYVVAGMVEECKDLGASIRGLHL